LTGRQEEALRCADRLGYFAVPRRASLGAVAGALGISRSATAELLRRGVSVMIRSLDGPRLSSAPALPGAPG
ncbi:Bacterio-opsin activator, HTH domain protein, partial [mine drainage metagenome]